MGCSYVPRKLWSWEVASRCVVVGQRIEMKNAKLVGAATKMQIFGESKKSTWCEAQHTRTPEVALVPCFMSDFTFEEAVFRDGVW